MLCLSLFTAWFEPCFGGIVVQNLGWNMSGAGFVLVGLEYVAQGGSSIRNDVNQIRTIRERAGILLLPSLQCCFE